MSGYMMRGVALALVTFGLGACGGLSEGGVWDTSFWDSGPAFVSDDRAELGLAELLKGNHQMAEVHFNKALQRNRNDVVALMGLGMLYQHQGHYNKARQMYEAILALRPDDQVAMVVLNSFDTQPISQLASVNLHLMESGGVVSGMEQGAAGLDGAGPGVTATPRANALMPRVSGAPSGNALLGRPAPGMGMGMGMGMAMAPPEGGLPSAAEGGGPLMVAFTGGEGNVVSRFQTLLDLRNQGLVTEEEFSARRQANIGALLPLTAPPPAAGLDRPVPASSQISGRLRAIGRALEMRAITVSQHAAERSMILDALMPSAPVVVANPGTPPQGLLAAADAVRKLEQLKDRGLITSDEYAKERGAIERGMQPQPPAPGPGAAAPGGQRGMEARPRAMGGPQPAVHLASYRSQKQAERGWAQLRRAYRDLLGGLDMEVSKVDLGPGKGIYYRLKAGPLGTKEEAADVCRQLKQRRQYCEPGFMGVG